MSKIIAQTGGNPMTEQEALAAIKEMKEAAHWYRGDHKMAASIGVIEKLVDKQTPKEPLHGFMCPNCHSEKLEMYDSRDGESIELDYCPDCGQPIMWPGRNNG